MMMKAILFLFLLHHVFNGASSYSLQGKRALVTGSAGGIGRAIALALAERGCQVLVHYHVRKEMAEETARLISEISADSRAAAGVIQADFRDPNQIEKMMQVIDQDIWPDGLDILVNNAGIVTKLALEDDDDKLTSWHETLQVNLHAPLQLSRLCLPRMKQRQETCREAAAAGDDNNVVEGSVILQISSIHGDRSVEYMAAYATSKAALDALTRTMALEFAPHNIRVNGIAPGVVPVERTAEAFAVPATVSMWTEKLPLGRTGTASEIAEATVQMIQNDWVTGSIWQIDGGMMARANMPNRPRPKK